MGSSRSGTYTRLTLAAAFPWISSSSPPQGDAIKAYENQSTVHTTFNQAFASTQGNWLVPALHAVCRNTHRLARAADEASKQSHDQSKLENAATILQESFSRTFNDRKELIQGAPLDEDGSKKVGVLSVVTELFAIYFRLNTLRLCKNLVRPVEIRKLDEQGSMGELVTYRYYVGRLSLFEDQYADAEEKLEFALQNCHVDAVRNQKRILRYLVPVKLVRGKVPSQACKYRRSDVNRGGLWR